MKCQHHPRDRSSINQCLECGELPVPARFDGTALVWVRGRERTISMTHAGDWKKRYQWIWGHWPPEDAFIRWVE